MRDVLQAPRSYFRCPISPLLTHALCNTAGFIYLLGKNRLKDLKTNFTVKVEVQIDRGGSMPLLTVNRSIRINFLI